MAPIGLLAVAAARAIGARHITAADLSPAALDLATALGADAVVDISAGGALPADVEIAVEASGPPGPWAGSSPRSAAGACWSRWATCPPTR